MFIRLKDSALLIGMLTAALITVGCGGTKKSTRRKDVWGIWLSQITWDKRVRVDLGDNSSSTGNGDNGIEVDKAEIEFKLGDREKVTMELFGSQDTWNYSCSPGDVNEEGSCTLKIDTGTGNKGRYEFDNPDEEHRPHFCGTQTYLTEKDWSLRVDMEMESSEHGSHTAGFECEELRFDDGYDFEPGDRKLSSGDGKSDRRNATFTFLDKESGSTPDRIDRKSCKGDSSYVHSTSSDGSTDNYDEDDVLEPTITKIEFKVLLMGDGDMTPKADSSELYKHCGVKKGSLPKIQKKAN